MRNKLTEKDDLSSSLEDYLEAIYNLCSQDNKARAKDIAELLNVAKPSVTGALRALKKKGLANYEPYGCITLTPQGKKAALQIVKKHNILKSFFVNILDIDVHTAQKAACRAEHILGSEVITKLLCFIEFVNKTSKNGQDLSEEFRNFCSKSNYIDKKLNLFKAAEK